MGYATIALTDFLLSLLELYFALCISGSSTGVLRGKKQGNDGVETCLGLQ